MIGMNECGLTCDGLLFAQLCKWPKKEEGNKCTIRNRKVIDYILGNCANLD